MLTSASYPRPPDPEGPAGAAGAGGSSLAIQPSPLRRGPIPSLTEGRAVFCQAGRKEGQQDCGRDGFVVIIYIDN